MRAQVPECLLRTARGQRREQDSKLRVRMAIHSVNHEMREMLSGIDKSESPNHHESSSVSTVPQNPHKECHAKPCSGHRTPECRMRLPAGEAHQSAPVTLSKELTPWHDSLGSKESRDLLIREKQGARRDCPVSTHSKVSSSASQRNTSAAAGCSSGSAGVSDLPLQCDSPLSSSSHQFFHLCLQAGVHVTCLMSRSTEG